MSRHNIAAFTFACITPPYVSVNREDDGSVSIHVRGKPRHGEIYGTEARIQLSAEQYATLLSQMVFESANEHPC